jgi:uncharacterized protein (DUF1330 family)
MKGYVVANIEVADSVEYERYRSRAGAIVAHYGGRFLIRGGAITPLEGDIGLARLVVLEFPSPSAARTFYDSPDYQEISPYRTNASTGAFCIVEGVAEQG